MSNNTHCLIRSDREYHGGLPYTYTDNGQMHMYATRAYAHDAAIKHNSANHIKYEVYKYKSSYEPKEKLRPVISLDQMIPELKKMNERYQEV